MADKDTITSGGLLSDKHMDFAQAHGKLAGLQSTLLVASCKTQIAVQPSLQIVHSRGNHWIVVTTLRCLVGTVKVFDSLYTSADPSTVDILSTETLRNRHQN